MMILLLVDPGVYFARHVKSDGTLFMGYADLNKPKLNSSISHLLKHLEDRPN